MTFPEQFRSIYLPLKLPLIPQSFGLINYSYFQRYLEVTSTMTTLSSSLETVWFSCLLFWWTCDRLHFHRFVNASFLQNIKPRFWIYSEATHILKSQHAPTSHPRTAIKLLILQQWLQLNQFSKASIVQSPKANLKKRSCQRVHRLKVKEHVFECVHSFIFSQFVSLRWAIALWALFNHTIDNHVSVLLSFVSLTEQPRLSVRMSLFKLWR